jgi:hypothetical protein
MVEFLLRSRIDFAELYSASLTRFVGPFKNQTTRSRGALPKNVQQAASLLRSGTAKIEERTASSAGWWQPALHFLGKAQLR